MGVCEGESRCCIRKQEFRVRGIAHITGGGIRGNLSRIFRRNCKASLRKGSWQVLPVSSFLQRKGRLPDTALKQGGKRIEVVSALWLMGELQS
ncbi:MAG: hypothetical protein GTO13_04715 [Proteobacteria bacterium]|nr:hypothetical protein [Pseudomonadota bacterium]